MAWSSISSALSTLVGGVTGITGGAGKVLTYRLRSDRPDLFKTAVKGTSRVNVWMIYREGRRDAQRASHRTLVSHDVRIEGWYSIDDDGSVTEAAFDTIVDAVCDALQQDTTVWVIQPESGPIASRAVPVGHDRIAGVLCHYVSIRMTVDEVAIES